MSVCKRSTRSDEAIDCHDIDCHEVETSELSVQALRCTRLAGLTISFDPKFVSEVFDLAPHSLLHYLAATVDASRT
jgi:hypothetical protein